ncbi:MAG: hypothetical protein FWB78_06185 [Treponema sp.]|nr:hypothetical protein [Treponema sp.]
MEPSPIRKKAVLWVENVLSWSDEFKLKDLKERFKQREGNEPEIKIVLLNVEEQPVERPTYNQKDSYSGKKTAYGEIPGIGKRLQFRNTGYLQRFGSGT